MKKIVYAALLLIFVFLTTLVTGCKGKVEVVYPDCYDQIKQEMKNENYKTVLELLNSEQIQPKQKTDWYYYDRAVALYKLRPAAVRYSINDMKFAAAWNSKSFEINYYLGKFYFEIAMYAKALNCFKKCSGLKRSESFVFKENISVELWQAFLKNAFLFHEKQNPQAAACENVNDEELKKILSRQTDVHDILSLEGLDVNEKIMYSEIFFYRYFDMMDLEYFIEAFIPFATDEPTVLSDYARTELLYFYVLKEDYESVEKLLSVYDHKGLYLLSTDSYYVNEKFYKYMSFMYWKLGDGLQANGCLNNYDGYHNRPLNGYYTRKSDLKNVEKIFRNDEDFIRLKKMNHNK